MHSNPIDNHSNSGPRQFLMQLHNVPHSTHTWSQFNSPRFSSPKLRPSSPAHFVRKAERAVAAEVEEEQEAEEDADDGAGHNCVAI